MRSCKQGKTCHRKRPVAEQRSRRVLPAAYELRVGGVEGQLIKGLVQIDFGHPVTGLQLRHCVKDVAVFKYPATGIVVYDAEVEARAGGNLLQAEKSGAGRVAELGCPDVCIERIELVEVALIVLGPGEGHAHVV